MPLDVSDQTNFVHSLSGQSFAGYNGFTPAAGQYTNVQLWNPANSGVNAIVYAITLGTNVTTLQFIDIWPNTALLSGSTQPGLNKLNGAANSKCVVAIFSSPTVHNLPYYISIPFTGTTFDPPNYQPAQPIILRPGYGLVCSPESPNVFLTASFEWVEM